MVTLKLTCNERPSIVPASQNGTNAKYAKKRPAAYLHEEIKKLV